MAAAPFNKPSADVILRSSDRVDFHVHKVILEEVSPFFADMFSHAHASPLSLAPNIEHSNDYVESGDAGYVESRDTPLIGVIEHSTVLEPLLRSLWPAANYKFKSLDALKPAIAAADKYQMDDVLLSYRQQLINRFARTEPLRVYAIGAQYGMNDVMRAAARSSLSLSTTKAEMYVHELRDISGRDYFMLLDYRRRCVSAAKKILGDLSWLVDERRWTFTQCNKCARDATLYTLRGSTVQVTVSFWMASHLQRLTSELIDRPCCEAIKAPALCDETLIEATRCDYCRRRVHEHLRVFMTNLNITLDKIIDEIPLSAP
ncbi:hypothetical protein C8Q76DRAFT_340112 [Earliella scabrosa]|nr:hypothetical protein C8Q76DRAFT_340112 [Earliella scabrosa]